MAARRKTSKVKSTARKARTRAGKAQANVIENAQHVWLAGMGAVAKAQKEGPAALPWKALGVDVVIESDVNILDIAALAVIVREAGGVFTDLSGAPLDFETRSVLAAAPALHADVLARFEGWNHA